MSKYKVKVIQMALRNNKLAQSGDVVSESQLTGNAGDLEKKGFIEKVGATEKSEEEKAAANQAAKEAFDQAYEAGELDEDQLESITMKEIYEYAKKHALKYDEDAKKAGLIKQVLKAEKVEE